ncbi:hypothetical protein KM043_015924 [Ampulex compressa]|nr:hypothetical protein KM043_015924 [Ampulex compressa]
MLNQKYFKINPSSGAADTPPGILLTSRYYEQDRGASIRVFGWSCPQEERKRKREGKNPYPRVETRPLIHQRPRSL